MPHLDGHKTVIETTRGGERGAHQIQELSSFTSMSTSQKLQEIQNASKNVGFHSFSATFDEVPALLT